MLGLGFFRDILIYFPTHVRPLLHGMACYFGKPMVPGIGLGLGFGGYRRFRSRVYGFRALRPSADANQHPSVLRVGVLSGFRDTLNHRSKAFLDCAH